MDFRDNIFRNKPLNLGIERFDERGPVIGINGADIFDIRVAVRKVIPLFSLCGIAR